MAGWLVTFRPALRPNRRPALFGMAMTSLAVAVSTTPSDAITAALFAVLGLSGLLAHLSDEPVDR